MRNFIYGIFSLTLLFSASVAKAGFLIEPDLGIVITSEMGRGDSDNFPITVGGRVGYQFLGLMFGGDYHQTPSSKYEYSDDSTRKYDISYIGAFVGYNLPVFLRFWATLVVDATAESSGLQDAEGDGYKLGVGFTGLPFISINFELIDINFDERGSTDIDMDYKAYALSVSLPLDL